MYRYCIEYRGSTKDRKYVEEVAEQVSACKEADQCLRKSTTERLHALLITSDQNKENKVEENKTVEKVNFLFFVEKVHC